MSGGTWLLVLIIFNVILVLQCLKTWDKQAYPDIPYDAVDPRNSIVRKKIVLYHNFYRTKVQPPASNMLMMSWHPLAAKQAQDYAEKCIFLEHNDGRERTVPFLGGCGQNLYVSEIIGPWFLVLKSWFLEYQKFTYGTPISNFKDVGHYTQMVWATSHKVGCGLAQCPGGPWGSFYNYVCHYCPAGNFPISLEFPYKAGMGCAECPNSCVAGLCTNACDYTDYFGNCAELIPYSGYDTICNQEYCNATCRCGDKIHKIYPWT